MINRLLVVIQNCYGYTIRIKSISQFQPGESIRFKWISVEDAINESKQFNKQFQEELKNK